MREENGGDVGNGLKNIVKKKKENNELKSNGRKTKSRGKKGGRDGGNSMGLRWRNKGGAELRRRGEKSD